MACPNALNCSRRDQNIVPTAADANRYSPPRPLVNIPRKKAVGQFRSIVYAAVMHAQAEEQRNPEERAWVCEKWPSHASEIDFRLSPTGQPDKFIYPRVCRSGHRLGCFPIALSRQRRVLPLDEQHNRHGVPWQGIQYKHTFGWRLKERLQYAVVLSRVASTNGMKTWDRMTKMMVRRFGCFKLARTHTFTNYQ